MGGTHNRKLGDLRYDQESAEVSVLELDNRIKKLSVEA